LGPKSLLLADILNAVFCRLLGVFFAKIGFISAVNFICDDYNERKFINVELP